MRAITLLSDFGAADAFVGQMKGVICSVLGGETAALVDLAHDVPPQDIFTGAFLLWSAVDAFAGDTVHLAVVDPGVGSARKGIAIRSRRGPLLVGPDNGLLVPAAEKMGGVAEAFSLEERRFWRTPDVSATFHGRDVFAPVAAHLAAGVKPSSMGPKVEPLAPIVFRAPSRENGTIAGEVLHVDRFGNLITNIPRASLPPRFRVTAGGREIAGAPHPHYQAVAAGEPLAIVGSTGMLELSVRDGSAAKLLGGARGSKVEVHAAVRVAE